MAVSQEKISVYNLADLKNTSDDAIPNYLNSLKFKQSHYLADVRLALGYGAFLVAAACFAWDYKFGFDNTKYYTAAAVVLYTILNGLLTLWIWFKEKNIVYVGTAPDGDKLAIATSTKKNDPTYYLEVVVTPKSGKEETIKISCSFTEWFDAQGHFIAQPFQEMFASAVPLIGKMDPKRVKTASHELLDAPPEVLAAVLGTPSATATGAEETPAKKSGKRRKN